MKIRHGVTPVVSIVLLLMLTVAIAGGAYTWVDGMIQERYQQAQNDLNTQLEMKDLQCDATTGEVDFYIKNTGSTEVSRAQVDVYLYQISDGRLAADASRTGLNPLQPTDSWTSIRSGVAPIDFGPGVMNTNRKYRIEFEFSGASGTSVKDTCTA